MSRLRMYPRSERGVGAEKAGCCILRPKKKPEMTNMQSVAVPPCDTSQPTPPAAYADARDGDT